jgi:hypothetical protein
MNAEDFKQGITIEVPRTDLYGRPFCLRITTVMSVSKETGAVELVGRVLSLKGTSARRRPLIRRVVMQPDRLKLRDDLR